MNSKEVIAVNAHNRNAIAGTARRNAIAAELVKDGGADSKPVVAAEEQNRALLRGGEVQCSVEIAFARSAFAKIADRNAIFVRKLEPIRSSNGLKSSVS